MRVVLVTHYFSTHGGGVEIVADRLARELSQQNGMAITWYASDCDPVPPSLPQAVQAVPMTACNVIERLTGLPYPVWSPGALSRLADGIRNADLVHVHDFAYPSSLAAIWLARRAGVPLVLTQHTGAVRPGSRIALLVYTGLERVFARQSFDRAGALVFVSATSRAHWEQRFGDLRGAVTIWNGVDVVALPSATARVAARLAVSGPDARPLVLFVGRLVRKKGIEIVRRVASALPDCRFLIAGRGPIDPGDWGLPNVRALGQLDAPRLRSLYLAADMLLLPSYSEGFPLVIQEALVNGLAVLTTDEVVAACPPVAHRMRQCPVPRDDNPDPWIAAVQAALADSSWLDDHEARAASATALWSWSGCASAYANLMRSVAKVK